MSSKSTFSTFDKTSEKRSGCTAALSIVDMHSMAAVDRRSRRTWRSMQGPPPMRRSQRLRRSEIDPAHSRCVHNPPMLYENRPPFRKAKGGFGMLVKLSPALAALVGVEEESRSQVVKKLWEYIKANNLQASS